VPNIEQLLPTIPSLADATVLSQLTQGPISDKWLLDSAGQRIVLRADRPLAQTIGLRRDHEFAALQALAAAGWARPPVWADTEAGLLAVDWVDGKAWTTEQLQLPENLARLAMLLAELHSTVADLPEFLLTERLSGYAELVGTAEAMQRAAAASEWVLKMQRSNNGFCLCHNDPVAGNVVESDRLYFIDFEFSATGDPLFDLAAVIEHHHLNNSLANHFISAYRLAGGRCEPDRLVVWRNIYRVTAWLWSAVIV